MHGTEILLLEDDALLRKRLAAYLEQQGATVSAATTLAEARRLLADLSFDYALLDLHLPDGEALTLLREKLISENTPTVLMTAYGGVAQAVEAIRLGATDFLTKPIDPDQLAHAFTRTREAKTAARRQEHRARETAATADLFFGPSLSALRAQLDTILAAERRIEKHLPPLLLEGETGTGKTALARWIHTQGPRASADFIALNCAALPESLAEAELFGHERGAFTDAKSARLGLLEAASGGTLFLDEIGSLSPATQAKLLTALEENRIRRLGSTKSLTIDTRIIAATNRPLTELVAAGQFREDLYHRLNLLALTLPPLRTRTTDLLPLATHLLKNLARRHRVRPPEITPEGQRRLLAQPWPGNVRELAHTLERALIFTPGQPLDFAHLVSPASSHLASETSGGWRNPSWQLPEENFALDQVIDDLIAEALLATNGNVSAAARRLGVTREFLRYRLAQKGNAHASPPAP